MSHYHVTLHTMTLVPRAYTSVNYLVQAPDSLTALERVRAIFTRQHSRCRILLASAHPLTMPLQPNPQELSLVSRPGD